MSCYLHYWNANHTRMLPHLLAFQEMHFEVNPAVIDAEQVFTIVGIGESERKCYLWSTYGPDGKGWHLSPPMALTDQDVDTIYRERFEKQLFKPIDKALAARLSSIAKKYRPPGNPLQLAKVLTTIEYSRVPRDVATQIQNALKKIELRPPPPVVPRDPSLPLEIRCLSIRQPWVHCILAGHKDVENRDWGNLASLPSYRGWLAIHASKTQEMDGDCEINGCMIPKHLPTGCIAGLAYLEDIVHIRNYRKYCKQRKIKPSEWANGEHCLLLSRPVVLPSPIPMNGRLGIFVLDESLQAMLRKMVQS